MTIRNAVTFVRLFVCLRGHRCDGEIRCLSIARGRRNVADRREERQRVISIQKRFAFSRVWRTKCFNNLFTSIKASNTEDDKYFIDAFAMFSKQASIFLMKWQP